MSHLNRALCLASALGLCFALGLEPALAAAQGRPFEKVPGKLEMRLKLPAPVMRNGAPFPLQIDFTSTFPDVIEGPLELTFYDEGILQLRFLTTPVVIAADSSTAYSIQLPSLTCIRTPTEFQVSVVLQSARKTFDLGKHDLLISLRGTRQFVIAAPGLNEVDVGQLVRSLSLDDFRPRKLNRQNFATYSTELDPHRILGDPMGLYPYDVVVLVGQHFSALSARQLETIGTWTESGGGLVVVPSGVLTDAHCRFLAKVTSLDLGSFQIDALGRLSPLGPGDPNQLVSGNHGFGRILILRSIPSMSAKGAAAPSEGRDADGAEWIRAVTHLWNVRSDQVDSILKSGTWQMPDPPPPKPLLPVTGAAMPKMLVRTDIHYSPYADVGGLVTQPPAAANALRDMLFPADVRVVPFGIVIGLLASFLVVVAPGDYWILGWLRRRRFTWIVFPIVSLLFTAITVAIAGYYSGNTDHRNSLVIVDLARDGRALRTSRIIHVITADTHMLTADVRDGLFAKTDVQPAQIGSDQPDPLKDPLDELPVRSRTKAPLRGHFARGLHGELVVEAVVPRHAPHDPRRLRCRGSADRLGRVRSFRSRDRIGTRAGRQDAAGRAARMRLAVRNRQRLAGEPLPGDRGRFGRAIRGMARRADQPRPPHRFWVDVDSLRRVSQRGRRSRRSGRAGRRRLRDLARSRGCDSRRRSDCLSSRDPQIADRNRRRRSEHRTTRDRRQDPRRKKLPMNDPTASGTTASRTNGAPPMVEIFNLWVKYGSVEAVRGISFSIPRGGVFGFIGPNGAGKSSTIRVLATLQEPFAGWAKIDGIEIRSDPTRIRRKIGYLPDAVGLYEDLTVREYLHFFAAAYDLAEATRPQLIDDLLALTDLAHKIDAQVVALSRGMQQRLGLARVLLHDPDLLLLDEPASGLDPRARIEIREILKELARMGKTILISSHILHELSQLCSQIGILEAGELVFEGPLAEINRRLGLMQLVHAQVVNASDELTGRVRKIRGVESVEARGDRLSIRVRAEALAPRRCSKNCARPVRRCGCFSRNQSSSRPPSLN